MSSPVRETNPWRTFSIFISSTFLDMQSERDYLKNIVLPKVEEELEKRRIRLEIVDLRWGVDTNSIVNEGEREAHVLKVCLDEIKRCRPFFIGLLGDRYGWQPPQDRIRLAVEREGFKLTEYVKSVTALEIEFGVLANQEQLKRSVFYFRESLDYSKLPRNLWPRYNDQHDNGLTIVEKEKRKHSLKALKSSIRNHFVRFNEAEKVKTYSATWDAEARKIAGLEYWGSQVVEDILKEIKEHAVESWKQVPKDEVEQECAYQEAFIERYTHISRQIIDGQSEDIVTFCGRDLLLAEIKGKLMSNSDEQWGIMLIGESGSGKSAVYSKLYKMIYEEDVLVLAHSAGITPQSKSVFQLLNRWNRQLMDFLKIEEKPEKAGAREWKKMIPLYDGFDQSTGTDIERSQRIFHELLFRAADKKHIIILIDALDHFESTPRAQHMSWLPHTLPKNIRLLCTAIPETEHKAIQYHNGIITKNIEYFSKEDAQKMVEVLCLKAHKILPKKAQDILIHKEREDGTLAISNPLWLSLAVQMLTALDQDDFERINEQRDNDKEAFLTYICKLAKDFPSQPGPLFIDLVHKAGRVFGERFTRINFEFIACSRRGLREKDLETLMGNQRLDWSSLDFANLRRWFNAHLVRGGEDQQWDLVHSILKGALIQEIGETASRDIHGKIAKYLMDLKSDSVKSSEVMYHLLSSNNIPDAASYYSSSLTLDEIDGATMILGDYSVKSSKWIEIVLDIPNFANNPESFFERILFNYVNYLDYFLSHEGNLDVRQLILEHLENIVETKYARSLPIILNGKYLSLLYSHLGVIHFTKGNLNKAANYVKEEISILSELSNAVGSNLIFDDLSISISKSYQNLAAINEKLGMAVHALKSYEKSLEILELERKEHPDKVELVSRISKINGLVGKTYLKQGQSRKANFHIENYYNFSKIQFESNPSEYEIAFNVAESSLLMGEVTIQNGRVEQGLKYLNRSLNILKELYTANPNKLELRIAIGISYLHLGDACKSLEQYEKALEFYQEAQDSAVRIYESDSAGLKQQVILVQCYLKSYIVYSNMDQPVAAYENLNKGNQLAVDLSFKFPDNEDIKRNVAVSYSNLGDLHQSNEQYEEAVECFEKGNVYSKDLHGTNPTNFELIKGLVLSFFKLGEANHFLGRSENAISSFSQVIHLTKDINNFNTEDGHLPKNLAINMALGGSYSKLGLYFKRSNDFEKALEYSKMGNKIFEFLAKFNPQNIEFLDGLSVSYLDVGSVYTAMGLKEKGLPYLQKWKLLVNQLYHKTKSKIYSDQIFMANKMGISAEYNTLPPTKLATENQSSNEGMSILTRLYGICSKATDFLKLNDQDSALKLFHEIEHEFCSLDENIKNENLEFYAETLMNLGIIYHVRTVLDSRPAEEHLTKAFTIVKGLSAKEECSHDLLWQCAYFLISEKIKRLPVGIAKLFGRNSDLRVEIREIYNISISILSSTEIEENDWYKKTKLIMNQKGLL